MSSRVVLGLALMNVQEVPWPAHLSREVFCTQVVFYTQVISTPWPVQQKAPNAHNARVSPKMYTHLTADSSIGVSFFSGLTRQNE